MGKPKRDGAILVGGCIVRHVYAADLVSIVLRGPGGRGTGDDLTLALSGVRTLTRRRPIDPPPHALRLYDPDADRGETVAEADGPCPAARDAAERLVASADRITCRIPVTGRGWLDGIGTGARVYGDILLHRKPTAGCVALPVSLAAELLRLGHVTATDHATDHASDGGRHAYRRAA